MEIEQDPPLSFAYNHSLVKQLTIPKPKHTTMNNTKDPSSGVFDGTVISPNQSLRRGAQKQYHKKQVRRRLHSSRPYQERLLNMAEARREIVTALKYHRASMKQATEEQQQQQQQSLSLQTSHVSTLDQDGRFKSRRNPRIHPSCTTKVSNHRDDFSYSSSHPPLNYYANTNHVITSPFSNPLTKEENPNFTLPNQTLGLNLNLHHFNNLEATLFLNNNNNDNSNSSLCSYSSQTSSSRPLVTDQDHVPSVGTSHSPGEGVSSVVDKESNATIHATRCLHTAMDDEGMAEIRSLGEQHQMEWNDTMSLVTSAWWFSCLKNMGHGATHNEDGAYQIFGELNEFPTLFNNNANESSIEQSSGDYFQDPTLQYCVKYKEEDTKFGWWLRTKTRQKQKYNRVEDDYNFPRFTKGKLDVFTLDKHNVFILNEPDLFILKELAQDYLINLARISVWADNPAHNDFGYTRANREDKLAPVRSCETPHIGRPKPMQ